MRRLKGEFTSIDGKHYRVNIDCSNGSGEAEIVLGGEPFVTQMESVDMMYDPLRGSGATVQILTENFEHEIYTEEILGTKITLTDITDEDNEIVRWIGYATPCTYNQDWNSITEYLEIDCVDAISVLNNLKFSDTRMGEEFTFARIIDKCLSLTGIVKNWYISDNISILGYSSSKNIVELLNIYDNNFFEEKDSDDLSDLDRSWIAYDVLEQVMQFLGYNAVAIGEDVYFYDYDAIKHGVNSYHKFTVGNYTNSQRISDISYNFPVSGQTITEGGTQIGLDVVYDSVNVKDEFYKVDTENSSNSGKSQYNITYTDRDRLRYCYNWSRFRSDFADGFETQNATFQCVFQKDFWNEYFVSAWQFWHDDRITTYNYTADSSKRLVTGLREKCSWYDMMTYNGAYLVKYTKVKCDNDPAYSNSYSDEQKLSIWSKLFDASCSTMPLTDMIVLINKRLDGANAHIGPGRNKSYTRVYPYTEKEDCQNYPYFEFRDNSSFYFSGENSYLVIKGDITVHDVDNLPFPLRGGSNNSKLSYGEDKKIKCEYYIYAKLQIGDWFWNGDEWVKEDTYFHIFWQDECDKTTNKDTRSVADYFDKTFSFQNLSKNEWAYTEPGYWVKAPNDSVIGGELVLTIYANRDMWGQSKRNKWGEKHEWNKDRYSRYYSSVICIENFSVKSLVSNGKIDDEESNSDTVYTNAIGTSGINPLDDITFKICTNDNKSISYSTVVYYDNGTRTFLSSVYNSALNSQIKADDTTNYDNSSNLCSEEMYIYRIVSQYEKPRIVYDYHLAGVEHKMFGAYTDSIMQNRTFVATEMSIDYAQSNTSIKLIEKN